MIDWKAQGLSPRVRGNRAAAMPMVSMCGTIPACAGEPFPKLKLSAWDRTIPACAGEPE